LRLSGNDGRIRRKLALPPGTPRLSVKALRDSPEIDVVQTRAGEVLPDDVEIVLDHKVKTVLIGGRSTLLVTSDLSGDKLHWRSCSKLELKCY
jgi:hypothetical protein